MYGTADAASAHDQHARHSSRPAEVEAWPAMHRHGPAVILVVRAKCRILYKVDDLAQSPPLPPPRPVIRSDDG